jgi:hypothetical protein
MVRDEIKAAIMASISEEIDQWLDKQDAITSGYEYETQLMRTGQQINKLLMEHSTGKVAGSRNKKNSTPVLGKSK